MRISIAKRRESNLNVKISLEEQLQPFFGGNFYVSFTAIDKIGLNPKSTYNTPLGIYTYPIDYIQKSIKNSNIEIQFPPYKYRNYAWIIEPKVKRYHLGEAEKQSVDFIVDSYKKLDKNASFEDIDRAVRLAEEDSDKFWPQTIWYLSNNLSKIFAENLNIQKNIAWNKILQATGFSIWSDSGYGIIHPSEETQTVFLSKNSFKTHKKIILKSSLYKRKHFLEKADIYNIQDAEEIIEDDSDVTPNMEFLYSKREKIIKNLKESLKKEKLTKQERSLIKEPSILKEILFKLDPLDINLNLLDFFFISVLKRQYLKNSSLFQETYEMTLYSFIEDFVNPVLRNKAISNKLNIFLRGVYIFSDFYLEALPNLKAPYWKDAKTIANSNDLISLLGLTTITLPLYFFEDLKKHIEEIDGEKEIKNLILLELNDIIVNSLLERLKNSSRLNKKLWNFVKKNKNSVYDILYYLTSSKALDEIVYILTEDIENGSKYNTRIYETSLLEKDLYSVFSLKSRLYMIGYMSIVLGRYFIDKSSKKGIDIHKLESFFDSNDPRILTALLIHSRIHEQDYRRIRDSLESRIENNTNIPSNIKSRILNLSHYGALGRLL